MYFNNNKGLTLVEVLIAITITSFVLVTAYTLLFTNLNNSEKVKERDLIREYGNRMILTLQTEWNALDFGFIEKKSNYEYIMHNYIYEPLVVKNVKLDYVKKTIQKDTNGNLINTFKLKLDTITHELQLYNEVGNKLLSTQVPTNDLQIRDISMEIKGTRPISVELFKGNTLFERCYDSGTILIKFEILTTKSNYKEHFTCVLDF